MTNKFVRILLYSLAGIMLVVGICIFIYPLISAEVSDNSSKLAVENFMNFKENHKEALQSTEPSAQPTEQQTDNNSSNNSSNAPKKNTGNGFAELYAEMSKYNAKIYKNKQSGLCDAWSYEQSAVDLSAYGLPDAAVGVLRVPAMNNLEMPIYLGASYYNMSRGAVQLGETSMPIGGNNTNCVIAGHRGWNGARYFVDIEQLTKGDPVYIENLWGTLTYRVSEIKVINPDDIDAVKIQKGKDMVTLITCHPYLDNSLRYAVFCTRSYDKDNNSGKSNSDGTESNTQSGTKATAENETTAVSQENNDFQSSKGRIIAEYATYFIVPLLLAVLIIILAVSSHRRKKRNKK